MSTSAASEPSSSPAFPEPSSSPALRRGALVALLLLGAVVGLFSGLQATRLWDVGSLHLSAGALAAVAANTLFGALGAWGLRSRDAAFIPGIGWFLVVLALLFLPHPGGDIVVPGSGGDAIAFIVAGFVGAGVAAIVAARLIPRAPRPATPVPPKRR